MANEKISALNPVTSPSADDIFPLVNENNTRGMALGQLQYFMAMACRLATTANIDLNTGGLLNIDGVTTVAGNRVLVWQQSNAFENGIYEVVDGSWTRAENFNATQNMVRGTLIPILEGNTHAVAIFQHTTTEDITIDTTNISFAPAAVSSWGGIQGDINNQTDLADALNLKADITYVDSIANKNAYHFNFESNLTQNYVDFYTVVANTTFSETLVGVTLDGYEVSNDGGNTWISQATIADVNAYSGGLTPGNYFHIRAGVSIVANSIGTIVLTEL